MCLIVLGSACLHCAMASGRGETRLYLGDWSEHVEMNGMGRRWLVGFDTPASPMENTCILMTLCFCCTCPLHFTCIGEVAKQTIQRSAVFDRICPVKIHVCVALHRQVQSEPKTGAVGRG